MSFDKSTSVSPKFSVGRGACDCRRARFVERSAEAFAQPAGSQTEKSGAANEKIWSKEYWAQKGDVKLYMFRKRVGAPQAGKPALPVLFLVHGSSMSSTTFDVTVPGQRRIFDDERVCEVWI